MINRKVKRRGDLMKKGQAAMEFLMTYGWALLVVLIAIAALAFFGVLNPSRFLPSTCTLAPGFSCVDYAARATGTAVQLILQNGLGDNINSVILYLASIQGAGTGCTGSVTFAGVTSIVDGGQASFNIANMPTGCVLNRGTKVRADLIIQYSVGSGVSTIQHSKVGQFITGVEA